MDFADNFEFTQPTKDELKFKRNRRTFRILSIAYILVVGALVFFLQENLIFLSLLILFNAWVVYKIGVLAIRSLVFPFSFWMIQDGVDGSSSLRYSDEFSSLVEKSYIILRMAQPSEDQPQQPFNPSIIKVQDSAEKKTQNSGFQYIENKEYFKDIRVHYTPREIHNKLKSVSDLVQLYAETNAKIMKKKTNNGNLFVRISEIMIQISQIYEQIEIRYQESKRQAKQNITLKKFYHEDENSEVAPLFHGETMIEVSISESNQKLLSDLEKLTIEFRQIITQANNPINYCFCCRGNCFGLKFINLFHSNDQLEQMLQNNFDGRTFMVKSHDGTKLDCMFFPFNDEKVVTKKEMEDKDVAPKYLDQPTVIFFNPNAQYYQQQVHSPNAFWLKFFVSNQINVMAWNYRNYGRSEGNPNPYSSYHDSEAILKFILQELGIKGKIGCFGRSLGGTMATHLACSYPQYISFLFVDRSLGNLHAMSESSFLGTRSKQIYDVFSRHWIVSSDKNFYEAKCFKMLTQDPWDTTIDQYCALNAHVARLACQDKIGENRYAALKIDQNYNALRLLFLVENKLYIHLKQNVKKQIKKVKEKRKDKYKEEEPEGQPAEANKSDSGYPNPNVNTEAAVVVNTDEKKYQNCCCGYSTEVDQLSKSKKNALAIEGKWTQIAQSKNGISLSSLQSLIQKSVSDHVKQYESIYSVLHKAIVFINDLHGGLIKLGWVCFPNNIYKPSNLTLFIDNLLTYGSCYGELIEKQNIYEVFDHRLQRFNGYKELSQIIAILKVTKDEIKGQICKSEEESLKQLILACLHCVSHFFEGLRKLIKKYESKYNFGPEQVGHLVPLTVGHRDRPKEREKKYIETVLQYSKFMVLKEQPNPFFAPIVMPSVSQDYENYRSSNLQQYKNVPNQLRSPQQNRDIKLNHGQNFVVVNTQRDIEEHSRLSKRGSRRDSRSGTRVPVNQVDNPLEVDSIAIIIDGNSNGSMSPTPHQILKQKMKKLNNNPPVSQEVENSINI